MKHALVITVVAACSPGPSASTLDASAIPDSAIEVDGPAEVYPAFSVPIVQVDSVGGPVMQNVRVVPITYAEDPSATTIHSFLTAFGTSTYWPQMVAEYGVTGGLEIATSVSLAVAAPTTISDAQIRALLAAHLDGSDPRVGPVDVATRERTVYLIHFPATTDGTGPAGTHSCMPFGGYHGSFPFQAGHVIYSPVYDCPATMGAPTAVIGHELVEAATDPLRSTPAWNTVAPQFLGWAYGRGHELGDMCEGLSTNYVTPADLPHRIQRSWSNAAARGHHDPCVPAPDGAFFAAVPVEPDIINPTTMMPGTEIAAGASRTIDVELISDALSEPWAIEGVDDSHALTFAFDHATGKNGDTIHATITVAPTASGVVSYRLRSTLGTRKTIWWGAVGVQ